MNKKLYFTIDGRESDQRNGIKKYQTFQFDTTTNELKFIDKFGDEIKEISLGIASVVSSSTEEGGSENTSGSTDNPSGTTDNPSGGESGDTPKTSGVVQSYEDIEVTTSTPLTFRSIGTTTLQLKKNSSSTPNRNIQYSKNNGEWTDYPTDGIFQLADGDTVAFSGNNVNGFNGNGDKKYIFKSDGEGKLELYGNIMSLVNFNETLTTASQFESLFYYCDRLEKANKLLLPSNTTTACYAWLFEGCAILTSTPALPATELATNCYAGIFKDSPSITSIEVNFTSWNYINSAYVDWIYGIGTSGTFTKPSSLPEEYGPRRIPEGWTVVNK